MDKIHARVLASPLYQAAIDLKPYMFLLVEANNINEKHKNILALRRLRHHLPYSSRVVTDLKDYKVALERMTNKSYNRIPWDEIEENFNTSLNRSIE